MSYSDGVAKQSGLDTEVMWSWRDLGASPAWGDPKALGKGTVVVTIGSIQHVLWKGNDTQEGTVRRAEVFARELSWALVDVVRRVEGRMS